MKAGCALWSGGWSSGTTRRVGGYSDCSKPSATELMQ